MSETRVVHVNSIEWRETPEADRVYIGRAMPRQGFKASKWGNPFRVVPTSITNAGRSTAEALRFYRTYLAETPELLAALPELRGKTLGCWCKKRGDEPCHGDVLRELVERLT